ncbi:MAG: IclR family transcriptional regulator [Bacillota bacterium]|jgi:DNA-binding IclR family transcriptional regulator
MSTGNDRRVKTVQAVDRSLAILEALARHGGPVSLTVLSNKLGLNISTVHRLLNTLIVAGFVEQEPNQGRYRLGLKAFEVGNAALYNLDIRSIAKPYLKELVDKCNETANLSILDRGDVVYIDQVESSNIVKMFAKPGTRGPSYCTGSGKVMLAFLTPHELDKTMREIKFFKHTENTITDPRQLKKELEKIHQQGYSVDQGELEEGVQCVAAPIRNHEGKCIAAVSISGPASRITGFSLAELIRIVTHAANRVSLQLGFYR